MVRKRKEKEARKEVQSDASDSDDDDNNNVAYSNQIQKKQRHGKRNRVSGQYRATIVEANATAGVTITSQAEHKVLPFCCSNCTCDEAYREEASVHDGADLITPDASGTKLSHLKCCHGLARRAGEFQEDYEKRLGDWAPPILSAQASTEQKLDNGDIESLFQLNNTLEWITKRELAQAYKNAKRAEATFYNDDSEAHALDILCTNPNYIPKVKAPFDDRIRRIESGREQRRKATVLDCFAGVGTAELVLKRLGIDIQTVIYVEHDRVARHVYRSNHDPGYFNQEVTDPLKRLEEDNIEHVYEYSDFESLVYDKNNNQNNDNHNNNNNNNEEEEERESTAKSVSDQKVKDFLKLHGPIDIVLGGPPCIEFSTVNAYRKGINSKQGNYMVAFGELIRKIELFQDSPIYFLVENVVTKDEDLDGIRKAFQMDWDPITLDSQYFSPARRKRQFWTNIPLSDIEYNTDLSHIGPDSCLEQGFYLLAHIVDKKTTAKCNCLMGSAERMDERSTLRMYVFQDQPKGGKYCGRPLTVSEREHLMGYPPGYVETPVKELFTTLRDKAYALYDAEYDDEGEKNNQFVGHWRDRLPLKYHDFAGNYHDVKGPKDSHKFEMTGEFPYVGLQLFTREGKNEACYNWEEYSKHMIGLAFSVPVVEFLLKPLATVFARKTYPRFQYSYAWEETQKAAVQEDTTRWPKRIDEDNLSKRGMVGNGSSVFEDLDI